ncbi:MAG TPA: aldehyde ferredoxin oxidoreductase N-terminal domain-containing protein, partial [Spirochaetales bacterium]|nr:aldehyde ferredoxin oxidoreductase N-terminal domain-containing protein [Spirochaetales bacterium]
MIDKAAGIIRGEAGRYLDVDLDSLSFSVHHPNPEDLSNYLGGKGLGLKIIYDRLGSQLGQVDSLAGDNILAFLTGAILGSGAPSSARFAGITKSPLTGLMLSSSCGGPWGMAARSSGWDGLIIRGRADRPVILYMDHNGARFEDAGATWGMETSAAQAQLVTEKNQGALVIGPAGENLVPYAVIRSGNRYLGRGGMGAVMGSKNLKAVVAQGGTYTIEAAWPKLFAQRNRRAKIMMKRNSFASSFRAYGT